MKANLGSWDRLIRVVVGIVLLAPGIVVFGGLLKWISIALGLILLVTSVAAICPLYVPFGIDTRKPKGGKTPRAA
jgi:hypothetical protein